MRESYLSASRLDILKEALDLKCIDLLLSPWKIYIALLFFICEMEREHTYLNCLEMAWCMGKLSEAANCSLNVNYYYLCTYSSCISSCPIMPSTKGLPVLNDILVCLFLIWVRNYAFLCFPPKKKSIWKHHTAGGHQSRDCERACYGLKYIFNFKYNILGLSMNIQRSYLDIELGAWDAVGMVVGDFHSQISFTKPKKRKTLYTLLL